MLTRARSRGRLCWAALAALALLSGLWLTGGHALTLTVLNRVVGLTVSQGAVVFSSMPTPRARNLVGYPTGWPAFSTPRIVTGGYAVPDQHGAWTPDFQPGPPQTRLSLPFWLVCTPIFLAAAAASRLPRAGRRWWVRRRLVQAALFAALVSALGAAPRRWNNGFALPLGPSRIGGVIAKNGYLALCVMARPSWYDLQPWDPSEFTDRIAGVPTDAIAGSPWIPSHHRSARGLLGFVGHLDFNEQCWTAGLEAWFLLPALALPTLVAAWRSRMTRGPDGSCPRCHYDLSGQPSPGCPECGAGREGKTNTSPPSGARV